MKNEIILKVSGMTCTHCSGRLEKVIKKLPGVLSCAADHVTGTIKAVCKPGVAKDAIKTAVADAGFEVNDG